MNLFHKLLHKTVSQDMGLIHSLNSPTYIYYEKINLMFKIIVWDSLTRHTPYIEKMDFRLKLSETVSRGSRYFSEDPKPI